MIKILKYELHFINVFQNFIDKPHGWAQANPYAMNCVDILGSRLIEYLVEDHSTISQSSIILEYQQKQKLFNNMLDICFTKNKKKP